MRTVSCFSSNSLISILCNYHMFSTELCQHLFFVQTFGKFVMKSYNRECARRESRSDFFVILCNKLREEYARSRLRSIFAMYLVCSTCGTFKCQTILTIAYSRFCLRTRKRSRPGLRGHSLYGHTKRICRLKEELLSLYALPSIVEYHSGLSGDTENYPATRS